MVHDGKHEESVHFIRTVVVFGGVPFCLVSYIDTWCSFTLLTLDRSFPTPNTEDTAAMMDKSHQQPRRGTKRSSAYSYIPVRRTFLRAFRKVEFVQFLFPLQNTDGTRRKTSIFGLQHEQEGIKPSLPWLLYEFGEMGVMGFFAKQLFWPLLFPEHVAAVEAADVPMLAGSVQAALLYNFYSVITFGLTLLLKGKLSVRQFKVFMSQSLMATGMLNVALPPRGFLVTVLQLIVLGHAAALWTYYVSEPNCCYSSPTVDDKSESLKHH
jgi:hypothetical protein